jgi:hypothetical protein
MSKKDPVLDQLGKLRDNLKMFMSPNILNKLVGLLEVLGNDRQSFVRQYNFWIDKNGKDCRYAQIAKDFFEKDQAESIAKSIISLYHSWAINYEKEKNA